MHAPDSQVPLAVCLLSHLIDLRSGEQSREEGCCVGKWTIIFMFSEAAWEWHQADSCWIAPKGLASPCIPWLVCPWLYGLLPLEHLWSWCHFHPGRSHTMLLALLNGYSTFCCNKLGWWTNSGGADLAAFAGKERRIGYVGSFIFFLFKGRKWNTNAIEIWNTNAVYKGRMCICSAAFLVLLCRVYPPQAACPSLWECYFSSKRQEAWDRSASCSFLIDKSRMSCWKHPGKSILCICKSSWAK